MKKTQGTRRINDSSGIGLEEEISWIKGELSASEDIGDTGFPAKSGVFAGHDVLVLATGMGKVQTALALQHQIDIFQPDKIIYSGIAGALNPSYNRGDLIVSVDCVQYDLDLSFFGYDPGRIPGGAPAEIPADPSMRKTAEETAVKGFRVHSGRILTGDRFVASGEMRTGLRDKLSGDAVDMESAAAAFTSFKNGVPWLVIRCISDMADGGQTGGFKKFMKKVSRRTGEFIFRMMENPSFKSTD